MKNKNIFDKSSELITKIPTDILDTVSLLAINYVFGIPGTICFFAIKYLT